MGATTSSANLFKNLGSNEHLIKLSGQDYISPNDPFWNQLLSFTINFPKNRSDQSHLEELTSNLCKSFVINNSRTGNFGSLIKVFLVRASELSASALCKDDMFTWQACNALFIIRICCKYFVENLAEEVVIQQFEINNIIEGNHTFGVSESLYDDFLDRMISILIDVPVEDVTYSIHCESINIILTLLSIQLFHASPVLDSMFYSHVMRGKCSRNSHKLVKVLLENFIQQRSCSKTQHGSLYGITSAVASGLWSVVTLGLSSQKSGSSDALESEPVLANQSLFLLLVLCNHFYSDASFVNPYQKAFLSLADESQVNEIQDDQQVKVNFSALFSTICNTLKSHACTLLLYMFLHRVERVRTFCLTRTSIDQLVLPIMEVLYNTQEGNSQHLYMALIIILILSEDNNFSLSIHDIMLKNVSWFQERQVAEISLGGLMILVLIRTIQYNMTRMRDQYLHTNCLGALANMSSQFMNLHPYVAQRLVSLFALLLKKHKKILERLQINDSVKKDNHIIPEHVLNGGSDHEQCVIITLEDLEQELAIIEEVMRMTLEILNSCLCHSLNYNTNLVYSMLYQKDIFRQLSTHRNFQDIIFNIELILNYFTSCLEKHPGSLGVSEVHAIIKQSGLQFKKDRLKKFPELKFRYVEEERPEEFFIPYVWNLVHNSFHLHFNPSRIRLFPV